MEVFDQDFELPSRKTKGQVRAAVLIAWPDATFFDDPGGKDFGPMLTAYRNAEAEASWDKDGRTPENAHDAVLVLWPLDKPDTTWVTCDNDQHEVLAPLGYLPPVPDGIWTTTTVTDEDGNVISKKRVEE